MQPKEFDVFYRITPQDEKVYFESIYNRQMYENKQGGFTRKAKSFKNRLSRHSFEQFKDPNFKIPQSNKYRLMRLFDLYHKEVDLFPEEQQRSSFVEEQAKYNSFLAESGIISYGYLRTLFITQRINVPGYYQYFVKRNGEYYVQQCDDIIPVDRNTKKPLWNLSLEHPWQLVLFKAWLKECRSMEAMEKAEPFRLLEAFGLPAYRCFNFRKQLKFLKDERIETDRKKQKINNYVLKKTKVVIIAKTIDDPRVQNVGLIPNFAAYRTRYMGRTEKQDLYRLYSTLPCYWTGSYSPIFNNQLNELNKNYLKDMRLSLERQFLATQKQLTTYFNKFYLAPIELNALDAFFTQDCINIPEMLQNQQVRVKWLCFEVKQRKPEQNLLSISIQFPKTSKPNNRYPQFRYFLSRRLNEQQMSRSHFRLDVRGAEREGNMYIESNCDKWEYYSIDYVQGYHNGTTFFSDVVVGDYVLYVDTEFDSLVPITKPELFKPKPEQVKEIFDSTFFSVSQDLGVEASLKSDRFEQSISLNNSFEELGWGSIAIKTLNNAKHRIAMRIFPEKLTKAGFKLVDHYADYHEKEKNLVLVSSRGRPQIVVLEKIDDKEGSTIGVQFPPPGTVEFFKVTPEINYNYT